MRLCASLPIGDHSTVPDGESLDIETGRLVAGGTLCANAGQKPRLLWDQVRERDGRQHAQSAHGRDGVCLVAHGDDRHVAPTTQPREGERGFPVREPIEDQDCDGWGDGSSSRSRPACRLTKSAHQMLARPVRRNTSPIDPCFVGFTAFSNQ